MLVLTRKHQESVVIGGSDSVERLLKVTVLRVRGGEVSLGFEAPARIAIHRAEVWDRIRMSVPRGSAHTEVASALSVSGGGGQP